MSELYNALVQLVLSYVKPSCGMLLTKQDVFSYITEYANSSSLVHLNKEQVFSYIAEHAIEVKNARNANLLSFFAWLLIILMGLAGITLIVLQFMIWYEHKPIKTQEELKREKTEENAKIEKQIKLDKIEADKLSDALTKMRTFHKNPSLELYREIVKSNALLGVDTPMYKLWVFKVLESDMSKYYFDCPIHSRVLKVASAAKLANMLDFEKEMVEFRMKRRTDYNCFKEVLLNITTCYYATGDEKYLQNLRDISRRPCVPMEVRMFAEASARLASM